MDLSQHNKITVRLLNNSCYEINTVDNSKISGKISVITGNVGNGKNVLAMELLMFCALTAPIRAYSNFPVDKDFFLRRCTNPEYPLTKTQIRNLTRSKMFFLQSLEEFLQISKNKTHQLIIVDESNKFGYESRRSMSDANLAFSDKQQEIRHYNSDLILITQLYSQLDRRGRALGALEYHAVLPSRSHFRYAKLVPDNFIPFSIPKWYAKEFLYQNYDTSWRVNEDTLEEIQKVKT